MWRPPVPFAYDDRVKFLMRTELKELYVGAFGEKFRRQRERRGLELDAISNTTKISTRMLRALEDEHFDQLPGGVFNKGFVRAYARQIGLDEEEAVADYLAALRESQIQQQSILPDFRAPASKPSPVAPPNFGTHPIQTSEHRNEMPASQDLSASSDADADDHEPELQTEDRRRQGRRDGDRRRSNGPKYPAVEAAQPADESSASIPWGKLALALLLVTAALALWNFRRHAQPMAASPAAASPVVAPSNQSPAPAPVSVPASAATQPAPVASLTTGPASAEKDPSAGTTFPAPISAATSPSHTTSAPATPAASPAPSASLASPIPSPTASSTASAATKPTANPPQPDTKPAATHATARTAKPKPPATLNLLIRAEQTTWISLIADGTPITHETLIAPAHTSIRATREIVVRAGNAAGISFLLNGKEIPAEGNEGEVKTYIFDATGVHVAPQTQPPATNR
jgi:cytoskeletal protein RodZ